MTKLPQTPFSFKFHWIDFRPVPVLPDFSGTSPYQFWLAAVSLVPPVSNHCVAASDSG